MVDGLVLMDVEMHDARVPLLRELDRPSVLIGFPADPAGLTCVDLDFYRAGAVCVEHLAALGHREIALLGAPAVVYERGTGFAHRTMAGFRDDGRDAGASAASPCRARRTPTRCQRQVAGTASTTGPGLTGLVVHNEAAVGARAGRAARAGPAGAATTSRWWRSARTRWPSGPRPPLTSVLIPAEEVGSQRGRAADAQARGRRRPRRDAARRPA